MYSFFIRIFFNRIYLNCTFAPDIPIPLLRNYQSNDVTLQTTEPKIKGITKLIWKNTNILVFFIRNVLPIYYSQIHV